MKNENQKLEIVELVPEMSNPYEVPMLDAENLDEICNLEITEEELQKEVEYWEDKLYGLKAQNEQVWLIAENLVGRNFTTELPIKKETFAYKRNLQEVKKITIELYKAFNACSNKVMSGLSNEQKEKRIAEFLRVFARLMIIEKRKAEWLEEQFYPALFKKAERTARSEVQQYLIKKFNVDQSEKIKMPLIRTQFLDELTFLEIFGDKHPEAFGFHSAHGEQASTVKLRIPPYYTVDDEWGVYLVAVHEFVHSISARLMGGVGLERVHENAEMKELNEAITEILTFYIACEHLEKSKTLLSGEKDYPLELDSMAYAEYTILVKQIFKKIPFDYFVNAMINSGDMIKLKEKFAKEFNSPNALFEYAKKLKEAYIPTSKLKKEKNKAEVLKFPGVDDWKK